MEINVMPLGAIEANCYLISTEKAAVVIDPGFYSTAVMEFLQNADNKEKLILLTHGHFDHIGGALRLRDETATKIAIGKKDNPALSDELRNLSAKFQVPIVPFSADILLEDNDEITVGDLTFKVLETPGHTPGGVSYLCGKHLFSGDTLFYSSIGRTDFFEGNFNDLEKSIKGLYTLDNDTVVLSGHGPETTIGFEKKYNPYVRGNT